MAKCKWILRWQRAYKESSQHLFSPPLYFVKTDIRAAFDTLNQEKLLVVAAEVLRRVSPYTRFCQRL
jgi:hypothetical protein